MLKTILKQIVPQHARKYNIKGYAHLGTGKLTTQMPEMIGNFKFLLVFVDIFSGWIEVYPLELRRQLR